MKRFLKLWCAGVSVAALLCCFWFLHNSGKILASPDVLLSLEALTYVLWPSSLMLMSLSGQHPLQTLLIVGISLSVNGVIYASIGYGLWKIFRAGVPPDDGIER